MAVVSNTVCADHSLDTYLLQLGVLIVRITPHHAHAIQNWELRVVENIYRTGRTGMDGA